MDQEELQKEIEDVYTNLLNLIKLQELAKQRLKQQPKGSQQNIGNSSSIKINKSSFFTTSKRGTKYQEEKNSRNSSSNIFRPNVKGVGGGGSNIRLEDVFEYVAHNDDEANDSQTNIKNLFNSFNLNSSQAKSNGNKLRHSKLSSNNKGQQQPTVRFTMPSATGSKYETLNRVKTKYQPGQLDSPQPSLQFPGLSDPGQRNKSLFRKNRTKAKQQQNNSTIGTSNTRLGGGSNENLSSELQSESEAFMDVDNSSSFPSLSPNRNNVGFEKSQSKQNVAKQAMLKSNWIRQKSSTNNNNNKSRTKVGGGSMEVVTYSQPPTLLDSSSAKLWSTLLPPTTISNRKQTPGVRAAPPPSLSTLQMQKGNNNNNQRDEENSPISGNGSGSSSSTSIGNQRAASSSTSTLITGNGSSGGGGGSNSHYCNLLSNEFREKNQLIVATIQKQGSLTRKAIEDRNKIFLKMDTIRKQLVNIIQDVPRILQQQPQSLQQTQPQPETTTTGETTKIK